MYMDMYLNNLYLLTCTPISVILTHQLTKCCPQPCLEWMAAQVTRNRLASQWVLSQMDIWVEPYLLGNNNARVRSAAACLLTSLVPSTHFRNTFRQNRNLLSPHKEMTVGLRVHCFINVHYQKYLLDSLYKEITEGLSLYWLIILKFGYKASYEMIVDVVMLGYLSSGS